MLKNKIFIIINLICFTPIILLGQKGSYYDKAFFYKTNKTNKSYREISFTSKGGFNFFVKEGLMSFEGAGKYYFKGDTIILNSEFQPNTLKLDIIDSTFLGQKDSLSLSLEDFSWEKNIDLSLTLELNDSIIEFNSSLNTFSCNCNLRKVNTLKFAINGFMKLETNTIFFYKKKNKLVLQIREPTNYYAYFTNSRWGLFLNKAIIALDAQGLHVQIDNNEKRKYIIYRELK